VPTKDEDLAVLGAVTTDLAAALTAIEEYHWALATPCADWSLRDLVDHVIGGNWYTSQILAGDASEDALTATIARFGGEPVSGATAVESAIDQLEAFSSPGALDRWWDHVAGELTGRQILGLRLHDLIVHTWDINQTRWPPALIPKSLADWGLRELERPGSLMSKHFEISPAASDRPAPVDAASRYLRSFGR